MIYNINNTLILILILVFLNLIYYSDGNDIFNKRICKDGGAYLVAHECDCSLFYDCGTNNDGKEILKKCPYSLHFNSELLLCDDPKKVACKLDCSKRKEILSIRLPNLENILKQ